MSGCNCNEKRVEVDRSKKPGHAGGHRKISKSIPNCQGRATEAAGQGTLRAKAVRIRGSPDSAYPFLKAGGGSGEAQPGQSGQPGQPGQLADRRQEMLVADSGLEE